MTDSKQSKSPKDGQSPDRQSDNLWVWNAGAEVPKKACKAFDRGAFKGTDINRMWRIQILTDLFGPAGIGWSWKIIDTHTYKLEGLDRVVIFARGELRLFDKETKQWSEPIIGFGGNDLVIVNKDGRIRINDEAEKMVDTDAFGHACSKLGIGASVYWNEATKYTSADDDVGYVQKPKTTAIPVKQTVPKKDPFFKTADDIAAEKADDQRKTTKMELVGKVREYQEDAVYGAMAAVVTEEVLKEYNQDRIEGLNIDRLKDLISRIEKIIAEVA